MPSRELSVEPDITRAWTPPAWLYTDADVFRTLRERVFPTSWQLVDAARPAPGHVQPFTLLEGALDEPLVWTHDAHGAQRCLSNVCTHRGYLVCTEAGARDGLRCGYHGRTFGLDGRFHASPEFEGARDFPSPVDDLPELGLERFGPLTFTSLDPLQAFDEWIAPLRERLGWFDWDSLAYDPVRSRDYELDANWVLYCENFLEGFHIPFVHADLNRVLDFGDYTTETFERASVQCGVAKPGESAFEPPPGAADHGRRVAGYYWWLFPNTMVNVYPWGLSLNVVVPLAVERTKVLYRTYVGDPDRLERGAGAGLHQVELEDEAIVCGVQRGMRARLYGRGRYAPEREVGTHHFHRLLAHALRAR